MTLTLIKSQLWEQISTGERLADAPQCGEPGFQLRLPSVGRLSPTSQKENKHPESLPTLPIQLLFYFQDSFVKGSCFQGGDTEAQRG